jgi:hypothetical protein
MEKIKEISCMISPLMGSNVVERIKIYPRNDLLFFSLKRTYLFHPAQPTSISYQVSC